MSDILNFFNAHNLPIFQPILMILVSKFMVQRALSDKTYLSLGLLSPINRFNGAPTSRLVQMWIKTHRCLVCMKDP